VPPSWTIRSVLEWTRRDFESRGIESARLDAELLLARCLGIDRVGLYLDLDRPLAPQELVGYRALVARRRRREPVAYILGERAFYGRVFEVSPAVLVPRPDTETLVERALGLLAQGEPSSVLDLCTGSGAIGLTLAAERPDLRLDATDISAEALELATRNAAHLGVSDRVRFVQGDLLDPLEPEASYDLIVANPPYIPEAEVDALMPEVALYEPRLALAASGGGLAFYRRIASGILPLLRPGATLLVEIGIDQAASVLRLFAEAGLVGPRIHRDLGGIERVVEASRP